MSLDHQEWLRRYEALIHSSHDFIAIASLDGKVQFLNNAGRTLIHMPDDVEIEKTTVIDYLTDTGIQASIEVEQPAVIGRGYWNGRGTLRDWSGAPAIPVEISSFLINDLQTGEPMALATIQRDIRVHIEAANEIHRMSLHDTLTGLANRELFNDRLGRALRQAKSNAVQVGVIYINVDRFAEINAGIGHAKGDAILKQIAARIKASVRETDCVARLGGDEFLICCPALVASADAVTYGLRILNNFTSPIVLDDEQVYMSVSAGVAFGFGESSPQQLVSEANAALHRAKKKGRSRLEIAGNEIGSRGLDYVNRFRALHQAIANQELVVYYQPILSLTTSEVVAAEALVRWQNPDHGLIGPSEFVALAEQTGLIDELYDVVLDQVCATLAELGRSEKLITISVNVSSIQLSDSSFAQHTAEKLNQYSIGPGSLVIELTESAMVQDIAGVTERLNQLKAIGTTLSIDDFGTGYSSVRNLRHLPFDTLKIDREFVSGIDTDPHDLAIVKATIAIADALAMTTIAEGVENTEQERILITLGCGYGQGFLYHRPMSTTDFLELILG